MYIYSSEVDITIAQKSLEELQALRDELRKPTPLELEVAEEQLTELRGKIFAAWGARDTELLVTLGVADDEESITQSAVDKKLKKLKGGFLLYSLLLILLKVNRLLMILIAIQPMLKISLKRTPFRLILLQVKAI